MKVVLLEVSGWGGMCHYTYNLCERLSRLEVKVFQISKAGYELDNLPRQFHLETFLRTDQNYFKCSLSSPKKHLPLPASRAEVH